MDGARAAASGATGGAPLVQPVAAERREKGAAQQGASPRFTPPPHPQPTAYRAHPPSYTPHRSTAVVDSSVLGTNVGLLWRGRAVVVSQMRVHEKG